MVRVMAPMRRRRSRAAAGLRDGERLKTDLHGIDGALDQFGGLLGEIVHHVFALAARGSVSRGLADLRVHLLEFGAEIGGIGPASDDLLDAGALLAVAGEGAAALS